MLAYSTVSQLGYMFTAMGVGAFSAGAFHLMTHAFFKALLFLGSGSVIHAMGGEQDMRKMGNLKKYMPVTFATMMIGTLAIAGIPPFSGFFSKDEILFQAFLHNKFIWVLAVATALMTAFYMWRLMAMTFFGAYRGPAWDTGHGADVAVAAVHGVKHPADAHAHGQAAKKDHDHGPAEPTTTRGRRDDQGAATVRGTGRTSRPAPCGAAASARRRGFIGIPAALGGGNTIKHPEPSHSRGRLGHTTEVQPSVPSPVVSGFSRTMRRPASMTQSHTCRASRRSS